MTMWLSQFFDGVMAGLPGAAALYGWISRR